MREAVLVNAVLRGAVLLGADLRGAVLVSAYMRGADLSHADLRGANIDSSAWPLWRGSSGVIVCDRIARQLAAHFCAIICDSPEYADARAAILGYAQGSHRAGYLGLLGGTGGK